MQIDAFQFHCAENFRGRSVSLERRLVVRATGECLT